MKTKNHLSRICGLFVIFCAVFCGTAAYAVNQKYVRNYEYEATEFDTKYTSRVSAIDGVKQDLLEEIGTYIHSVLKVSENDSGDRYAERDYVSITAGITKLNILDEKWNKVVYFVKADMIADPDEVMRSVQALREDHHLEDSLRESLNALTKSRVKIKELMQALKNTTDLTELASISQEYVGTVREVEAETIYQLAIKAKIDGNFEEALNKFKLLAEKGYTKAQSRLGHMYEKGMGVTKDYDRARHWYLRAIDNKLPIAYARMGFLYERGLGVSQNFDKAAALYKQSSGLNSGMGHTRLGWLHQVGKGVEEDIDKARTLYQKGVDKDSSFAYARLGYLYQKGLGVDEDDSKAVELFEKSVAKGNGFGYARLGQMYLKGWAVEKDHAQALALFKQAVRRGNPFGHAKMGLMYERGYEVGQDTAKAFEYYTTAANLKSRFGMFRLGHMYEKGKGVSKDITTAKYWYRKAADLGHKKSKKRLRKLE